MVSFPLAGSSELQRSAATLKSDEPGTVTYPSSWRMKNPTGKGAPTAEYVLGHSDRELERLSTQARLLEPITREFLISAGIVPGMRILDAGSGGGDVAFLAADLAGDEGSVVGVDRASTAIVTARRRAEARRIRNVSFLEGDAAEMTF